MTKIFYQIKSKTDEKHYSTGIETDGKEITWWSCECEGWSWWGQSKKNLCGLKPCIHILLLYKRICIAFNKHFIVPEYFKLHSKFEEIEGYLNEHLKGGENENGKKEVKPDTKNDSIPVCPAGN